ncbi:MAG TPA: flagellar filament capping protein FliD [Burkholderiaceae bacterium]
MVNPTIPRNPFGPGANLYGSGGSNTPISADVYAKVGKILEKQNTVAPILNEKLTASKTKLSGLGQLQSALATFQGVAKSLSGGGVNTAATSSSPGVAIAAASGKATPGSYNVQVQQIASGQVLQSRAQASAAAPIGSGTPSVLKIELGSFNGSSFTAGKTAKEITIGSGNNSLQGIAAAINQAGIGVTAAVKQGADGYVLSLTGPEGAASSLRIGVAGDPSLKAALQYDPAGVKGLNQIAAAKDAQFTVNGAARTSATNTVADAPAGVTLTLKGTGSATVTVAKDASQIGKNVERFVAAYNALNARLDTLKQTDLKTVNSVRNIDAELEALVQANPGDANAAGMNLAKLGIIKKGNGELEIDAAALQAAITADPAGVTRFLTDGGRGLADRIASRVDAYSGSGGSLTQEVASVNKGITELNAKKASVEQAMLAKANALVKLYSQQTSNPISGMFDGTSQPGQSGGTNIFDFLG